MTIEQVQEESKSSEIILRASEILSKRAVVYTNENLVSLGVVGTASSSSTVASQRIKSDVHRLSIYKPCEMGRNIVCLRYLLSTSFVLLCISGAIVCGAGSYFLHQLRGSLTLPEWYIPPSILLTTGIINVFLGPYFWHSFDAKYNRAQLFMFLTLIVLIAIIQTGAGIWSIVSYIAINSSLWDVLHDKLASVGTKNNKPEWNATEIKVNCCGFDNSTISESNENTKISWSCCNTRRYNVDSLEIDTCTVFYMNECRHLALHRYESILFHVFILALCAVIYQIYTIIWIRTYTRALRKSMKIKRDRSFVAKHTISQPQTECHAVNLGPQHVCEGCSNTRQ